MEFSYSKLILVLVIILLLFGSTKIPKIGHDLGMAIRNFKKSSGTSGNSTDGSQGNDKKDK